MTGPIVALVAGMVFAALLVRWLTRKPLPADFTLPNGLRVYAGPARAWLAERRSELAREVNRTVDWWCRACPGNDAAIDRYIAKCALYVGAWADGSPRGYCSGKSPWVGWPQPAAYRSWVGDAFPKTWENRFWAVLRHEIAHACCYAMGVSAPGQHGFMDSVVWEDWA